MTKKARSYVDDLRGANKLAIEATKGVTGLVEEMHRTISAGPAILGKPLEAPARLVTGVVYGSIRAVTSVVGAGIDAALAQLAPLLGDATPGPERMAVLAALNGVLGDYLDETNNPLAIEMRLRRETPASDATRKLLVMLHGSCMSDQQWLRSGHDHGTALARELGYDLVCLQYNSGKHVSTNGADFAVLFDEFVSALPVPPDEIVIVAHSMGGLVTRSACHVAETAKLAWRAKLRAIIFLGTPHHGSPLERGGNWVDVLLGVSRYSAPLAKLGKIRSAGVTDMRYGNVLDEHWQGRDRFEMGRDQRTPLPLPHGVACYAIAATTDSETSNKISGDGLVPIDSALGRHAKPALTLAFPEGHTWIGVGTAHLELLDRPEVYEKMRGWLG